MAHELADPQLTLREHLARAGIALMPSAGHGRPACLHARLDPRIRRLAKEIAVTG
jgi:hypothetical protein